MQTESTELQQPARRQTFGRIIAVSSRGAYIIVGLALALLLSVGMTTAVFAQSDDDARAPTTETVEVTDEATDAETVEEEVVDEDAAEDTDAQAEEDVAEPGILIVAVQPDSPAAEAGLARGDILLTLDGEEVNDVLALAAALDALEPGATVELTWRHGTQTRTASVELNDLAGRAFLGVQPYAEPRQRLQLHRDSLLEQLDELEETPRLFGHGMMGHMGMMAGADALAVEGVIIRDVLADSPAAEAGLTAGMIIVAVNGEPVTFETFQDTIQAFAPGDTITLEVREAASEETESVDITLSAREDDEETAFLGVQLPLMRGAFDFQMRPYLHRGMTPPDMMSPRGFRFQMPMHPEGEGMHRFGTPHGRGMFFRAPTDGESDAPGLQLEPGEGRNWSRGMSFLPMLMMRFLQWWGLDAEAMPMFRYFAPSSIEAELEATPGLWIESASPRSDFF